MGLSIPKVEAHIAAETARLANYRGRRIWPKFLFHATHVTNAVDIVCKGALSCRNKAGSFHDVANQGALSAFTGSHDNARLYFRPKNGYHLKTEGIKTLRDPYRDGNHMSIPVSFNFKSINIFSLENVSFTRGNVQRSHEFLYDQSDFDNLDFASIYHDSAPSPDNRDYIMDCRMAEVAVPDRIALKDNLHSIVFRSKWDMETFRYLLAQRGVDCRYRCAVEQVHSSIFMHWGMYISDLTFIDGVLTVKFHMPSRYAHTSNRYKISIKQYFNGQCVATFDDETELASAVLSIKNFRKVKAVWEIMIEDVIAFHGELGQENSEVF